MIEGSAQNIDIVRKLNCPESTAQIEERNVEKKNCSAIPAVVNRIMSRSNLVE